MNPGKMLIILPAIVLLSACSSQPANPVASACDGQIKVAAKEYEVASGRWVRGHPDLDRVRQLVKQAYREYQAGNHDGCTETVKQARKLVRPLLGS